MKIITLLIIILQCNILFAIENEQINFFVSTGIINNTNNNTDNNKNYDGLEASFGIKYYGDIKYLDNLYFKASYLVGDVKDNNYIAYTIGILYNIINYNILNIYVGYDILGLYNIKRFYNIGSTEYAGYKKDTKNFAQSILIGTDIMIYKGYYIYADYKNTYIKNIATTESITAGLRYRFVFLNKKTLPYLK